MKTFTYECPFCGTPLEATVDQLDQTVRCRNSDCQRSFKLETPTARLLHDRGDGGGRRSDDAAPHEEQRLRVVHPALLRRRPLLHCGALLLAVAGVAGAVWAGIAGQMPLVVAALIVAAVGLGAVAWWWLETRFVTLIITEKRSVLRSGILARRTSEVQHDDVRNLQVNQTALERLLGVGDIAISSAGQDDLEIHARGISDPQGIAALIRERQD